MEYEVFLALGAFGVLVSGGTLAETGLERVLLGVFSMGLWAFWSISALDVTKSVGVCCTYNYSYGGLAIVGSAVAILMLIMVVDEAFAALNISERSPIKIQ